MSALRRYVSLAALAAALSTSPALAGSVTVNGITMTWPEYPLTGPGGGTSLVSCEPWNSPAGVVTFTNVPSGATVEVTFVWFDPFASSPALDVQPILQFNNVVTGTLNVPVPYPMNTDAWPGFDVLTNARSIGVGVSASVTSNSTITKLAGGKWWVRCLPPPDTDLGGCTPGYWKQPQHLDSWQGYSPSQLYGDVFGVVPTFKSTTTLLDALWLGGGGEKALARHAVAALLNAAHLDFDYPYTQAEIIAAVQNAYATGSFESLKNQLDAANNAGCPLE